MQIMKHIRQIKIQITAYYTELIKWIAEKIRIIHYSIIKLSHQISQNATSIAKVLITKKQNQNKAEEIKKVTYTAAIRYERSSLWLEIIELLNSILNTKLTDIKPKHQISSKASTVSKLRSIVKVNNALSEVVDKKWNDLSKEAQELIKKYVEIQFDYDENAGNIENYCFTDKVAIFFDSLITKKEIITEYKYSAEKLISSLLVAMEEVRISNADLDFILSNSGF
jgi:hypothetical protein